MKLQKMLAIFSMILIISNGFAGLTAYAGEMSGEDDTLREHPTVSAGEPDLPLPDEPPAFEAYIEDNFQGYVVRGVFTEFPADISLVQPICSLDGETWQICGQSWDLHWMDMDGAGALNKLRNQICLLSCHEPLKSYLAEEINRFYLKLRLTRENGLTCETRAAVIDRGGPQPLPEDITATAFFAPSMAIYERRPFKGYGRYQLTVSENAGPEDIDALLPDTLPIQVCLQKGLNAFADGVIDCPVNWNVPSLPRLTAGECVTLADAAEEITVPSGALLSTPLGIFELTEPLSVGDGALRTDEVSLVLNVVPEDGNPTGVLHMENTGLEAAFDLKPTGATAIRAYALSQGESKWTELPALPLLDAVNAQPSTPNSGYTLVLDNTREPLRSYLAAQAAGSAPTPFLVGLKIEGGVYNGRQLILAWPETYDPPLGLPDMGGAGGNECNAGSDNKNNSTEGGQRPGLPLEPEIPPKEPLPSPAPGDQVQPEPPESTLLPSSAPGDQVQPEPPESTLLPSSAPGNQDEPEPPESTLLPSSAPGDQDEPEPPESTLLSSSAPGDQDEPEPPESTLLPSSAPGDQVQPEPPENAGLPSPAPGDQAKPELLLTEQFPSPEPEIRQPGPSSDGGSGHVRPGNLFLLLAAAAAGVCITVLMLKRGRS